MLEPHGTAGTGQWPSLIQADSVCLPWVGAEAPGGRDAWLDFHSLSGGIVHQRLGKGETGSWWAVCPGVY